MIDLRQYYLENVSEDEYYYRFYATIKNVNMSYNVFDGYRIPRESGDATFYVQDTEEAVSKFRNFCRPENEPHNNEAKCWFYVISFYLCRQGYYIEQFPNVLRRPPDDPLEFVYNEIRNWAFNRGLNSGGTIQYSTRRLLVAELSFKRKSDYIDPGEPIDDQFRRISTRDAGFQEMALDEKIREIANLIENMLKKNGQFLALDYSPIAFNYFDNEDIKTFRKQIQCFRHSSDESIAERAGFTEEQKNFLVDYGIILCKTIYERKKQLRACENS